MAAKKQTRVFKNQTTIMHDLYVLETENAIKNIAWAPEQFMPENIPHKHFFHSVDKSGAPQKNCVQINGHFHEMILVTPATSDAPATYKCGPAVRWVKTKAGVKKMAPAPFDDNHTHEIVYKSSEEFKPAKLNSEAMKLISEKSRAPEAVPGIVG